mgnify:CR=1 FL=1
MFSLLKKKKKTVSDTPFSPPYANSQLSRLNATANFITILPITIPKQIFITRITDTSFEFYSKKSFARYTYMRVTVNTDKNILGVVAGAIKEKEFVKESDIYLYMFEIDIDTTFACCANPISPITFSKFLYRFGNNEVSS